MADLIELNGRRYRKPQRPTVVVCVDGCDPEYIARGIADGDVVRIYNARGACLAGAQISDAVRPGVLRLACGAWYDPATDSDGALCVHGNANMLTRDRGTSKLAQGPTSATTLVEVERWTGPAPRVRAFEPPEHVAP